jgi:cation diffusion facilitator family transporter
MSGPPRDTGEVPDGWADSLPNDGESARTVVVALVANFGVALAKLAAAILSASAAVLAEALHAFADAGNELLLLVAQRRSTRDPDARHPTGYGREAYFWALIASIGVFVVGALLSVAEGVESLVHSTSLSDFKIAYAVLALALLLETVSLLRAYRQLHNEATILRRDVVGHLVATSDPTVRAVFAEDAAAVAGNVIALIAVALHQVTGSTAPDAIAAIVIGLLVGSVGWLLARRNRDFLVGEPAPERLRRELCSVIASTEGVVSVVELLVTFVGPRQVWVTARVDIDDSLTGGEVERLVREVEKRLEAHSPFIARADIVTSGPPARIEGPRADRAERR